MEIERKYLIDRELLPPGWEQCPHSEIEQGYLCRTPVLRIRRIDDDYIFTYKSAGLMAREEIEKPLDAAAYEHLRGKIDGRLIRKTRYRIPLDNYTIELDIFHGSLAPLILAEVEFPSVEEANAFTPPAWFGQDVTTDGRFHNSALSETPRRV